MQDIDRDELLRELARKLGDLTQKVESAFIKDEDGEPDYGAHRMYHRKQEEASKAFAASKAKIIRDILSWVAIGALTIIGSALVHTYMIVGVPIPK